jgi:HEPN domain-containing protein
MKMDEELLMIAKKDLQASRVLFDNRLYPQAIFFFQQSVEKANKSLAQDILKMA